MAPRRGIAPRKLAPDWFSGALRAGAAKKNLRAQRSAPYSYVFRTGVSFCESIEGYALWVVRGVCVKTENAPNEESERGGCAAVSDARQSPFAPYLSCIEGSVLFKGIGDDSLLAMLGCIRARVRSFDKGELVFRRGQCTSLMALVLEGAVRIERGDYWGRRTVMGSFGPGQTFGEVYASTPGLELDVDAVAVQPTRVLLMDVGRVTTMCPNSCAFHAQLIRSLLASVASRAHGLTRKIEHLSQRSTRAKLLSYLSDCAATSGSREFRVPFNRQELADYLSVDRSAMCAELSRMKRDGLIDYRKDRFTLGKGVRLDG